MSMLLPPFELHEPTTVEDAVRLKAEHPESDWLAGGTDLLPNYKWGVNTRPHVISLAKVEGLQDITPTKLGALARLTAIAKDATLKDEIPVIPATAREIASPLLRNSGTLGGNLLLENRCFFFNQGFSWRRSIDFCLKASGDQCHVVPQKETCYATFSADLPAPLIALDATYHLAGADGTRDVKARDFYRGDGIERNVLRPGELLTHVTIPEDAPAWRAGYKKLRQRGSWDFPEMGMAAALKLEGDTLVDARLVANALESTPVVLDDLFGDVKGDALTDEAIAKVAEAVEAKVRPVKNTSLPPSYRKKMTRVFTKRLLTELRDGKDVDAGPHDYRRLTATGAAAGTNGHGSRTA